MKSVYLIIVLVFVINLSREVESVNKYSAEANLKHEKSNIPTQSFKTLDKPFRMNKLNILWSKAQLRLSETKLKSLYSDLKVQDKEEITWKKLRHEGKDKEGLKEAELRRKLANIMELYNLMEHYEEGYVRKKEPDAHNEAAEGYINKSLFKDKKLNKLWSKAELSGFTAAEMQALKEEFDHHQNKIDTYYSILSDVKDNEKREDDHENSIDDKLEIFNTLESVSTNIPKKDYIDKANLLRDHHNQLRDNYDRLERLTSKGPNSKDFLEPKVQGLWKVALESNFSTTELQSLRHELLHYEKRLLKLRHLHAEAALHEDKYKEKHASGDKHGYNLLTDNIKKHSRKVEKMHLELETRIMQRHIEL